MSRRGFVGLLLFGKSAVPERCRIGTFLPGLPACMITPEVADNLTFSSIWDVYSAAKARHQEPDLLIVIVA